MADMHKIGYEKYCLELDRILDLVKKDVILTAKDFERFGNVEKIKGNEKQNLEADTMRDACILGKKLLFVMNKRCFLEEDVEKILESKEYIYRTFFRPDYEPIVVDFEK